MVIIPADFEVLTLLGEDMNLTCTVNYLVLTRKYTLSILDFWCATFAFLTYEYFFGFTSLLRVGAKGRIWICSSWCLCSLTSKDLVAVRIPGYLVVQALATSPVSS